MIRRRQNVVPSEVARFAAGLALLVGIVGDQCANRWEPAASRGLVVIAVVIASWHGLRFVRWLFDDEDRSRSK